MCPKGDDPLTTDQTYRQFTVTVYTSESSFYGILSIQFMSGNVDISLASPSSIGCINAFESSHLFQYVNCIYSKIATDQIMFDVTIYSWPVYPYENNLHFHDGNPLITDFFCDVSGTFNGVTCVFDDVVNANVIGKLLIFVYMHADVYTD